MTRDRAQLSESARICPSSTREDLYTAAEAGV
jgi:hypothetical protein